jgi:hypothetical protein
MAVGHRPTAVGSDVGVLGMCPGCVWRGLLPGNRSLARSVWGVRSALGGRRFIPLAVERLAAFNRRPPHHREDHSLHDARQAGDSAHLHPAKLNGWPRPPRVRVDYWESALRGRFWIFTTGWSVQPLPQPKKLIDHNADSQQHQQRHDDGGTHPSIIPAQGPETIRLAKGGHRLLVVLGDLVQTTTGRWITHPPTDCPNGHRLTPTMCSSVIKRASVTAAGIPPGRAANAARPCSGYRSASACQ